MKNLKYILFATILLLSQSCDNWLDVRPEDSIGEDELLSTYEGVEKIKRGIYLKLASSSLYSSDLAGGVLDIMGQLYSINEIASGDDQSYYIYHVNYTYDNTIVKGTMDGIWGGLYDVIANINNLLEKSVLFKEHYTQTEYNTLRGELIGLRAYLHFDALRLFGPMPNKGNDNVISIPYYTERTVSAQPLLSFNEVINAVSQDLEVAERLLLDDYVITGSSNRKYAFNYLAVKATQARLAMYVGDKQTAATLARSLVGPAGSLRSSMDASMPWVRSGNALSTSAPDRFFTPEIIFGIENSQRQSEYLYTYEYNVENKYFLAPTTAIYSTLLFDKARDYRASSWRENPGNGRTLEFAKYQVITDASLPSPARYTQPLIRRSELILILAEATSDVSESQTILNELYINRGYQSGAVQTFINEVGMEQFILDEYRRECFGEGQYFYQLKRRGVDRVVKQFASSSVEMGATQYVVPLPDSEIQYRD